MKSQQKLCTLFCMFVFSCTISAEEDVATEGALEIGEASCADALASAGVYLNPPGTNGDSYFKVWRGYSNANCQKSAVVEYNFPTSQSADVKIYASSRYGSAPTPEACEGNVLRAMAWNEATGQLILDETRYGVWTGDCRPHANFTKTIRVTGTNKIRVAFSNLDENGNIKIVATRVTLDWQGSIIR